MLATHSFCSSLIPSSGLGPGFSSHPVTGFTWRVIWRHHGQRHHYRHHHDHYLHQSSPEELSEVIMVNIIIIIIIIIMIIIFIRVHLRSYLTSSWSSSSPHDSICSSKEIGLLEHHLVPVLLVFLSITLLLITVLGLLPSEKIQVKNTINWRKKNSLQPSRGK